MAQVLYRKYRSKGFGEVIGQDHITRTLEQALQKGKVAHAYLFTGPRGTGKTSVARILAHAVNELPYDLDSTHLDIIEIDAASNRRIDEIRDLREKVHLAPVSARYKVYIIDEVHMLTNEAFNALLKTLEEPPGHVIFILATTEAHKVPETIISRTQRFSFRPIEPRTMTKHIADIAKREGLKVDQPALDLIAEHARGSFRDGLSLLDQLRSSTTTIDSSAVEALLGLPPHQELTALFGSLEAGKLQNCFEILERLLSQGVSAPTIARALAKQARATALATPSQLPRYVSLIERLLAVEASSEPLMQLEVALVASMPAVESAADAAIEEPVISEAPSASELASSTAEKPQAQPEPKPTKAPKAKAKARAKQPSPDFDWNTVLDKLKSRSEALYALLRMASADYDGLTNTLRLRFRFAFHAKRVESTKQLAVLTNLLKDLYGDVPTITIEQASELPEPAGAHQEATLGQVADILGGEIVEL